MEDPSNTKTASLGEGTQHLPVETTLAETKEQCNPYGSQLSNVGHDHDARKEASLSCSHDDTSVERQAKKDIEYQQYYEKWTSGMDASELQNLKDRGVDKPKIGYSAKGAPKADLADSSKASYEPDIAGLVDGDDEEDSDGSTVPDVLEVVRHLIAILMSDPNTRLTVECLALVLALRAYDGASMTEIAKCHGITPAAVSKRCVKLTEEFALTPPRAMRSILARENHRQARLKSNREKLP